MTDNEKRAHDLAISLVPLDYEKNYKESINKPNSYDFYDVYKANYDYFLERLNEDYH